MAIVPKGKVSKARRNSRKANWKISTPSMVECPHCHELKANHRVCKKCGNSYHIVNRMPKVEGICDGCGSPLIQRPDDTVDALKVRLGAYENQTKPLIEFYENEGLLKSVEGLQSIDGVFSDILKILEGK